MDNHGLSCMTYDIHEVMISDRLSWQRDKLLTSSDCMHFPCVRASKYVIKLLGKLDVRYIRCRKLQLAAAGVADWDGVQFLSGY